ncbi:MAG: hypothetical protein ACFBSE_08435 [Prochloraceae cyanobacterium]
MKELIADDRARVESYFDTSEEIKELLDLAILNWENTPESEKYIQAALKAAPESLNVAIAAYRYFFYKQNFTKALQAAEIIVDRISTLQNLPSDWENLKAILISDRDNPHIRLYLNAYTASGFVLTKLKQFDRAYQILSRVNQIDSLNEFGAKTMLDILNNPGDEEY